MRRHTIVIHTMFRKFAYPTLTSPSGPIKKKHHENCKKYISIKVSLYFLGLCDNIWGFSYKYAEEGEPCIVMEFTGPNPNFHGNMETSSGSNFNVCSWFIIIYTIWLFVIG